MPYDEALEARIEALTADWPGATRKKMFGGVCHLLRGNMFGGVYRDDLIVRLGPDAASAALGEPHTRPFDITGRAMKGWVMVAPEGTATEADLSRWLRRGRAFAETLPSK